LVERRFFEPSGPAALEVRKIAVIPPPRYENG
jgi:hypothetical protein